MPLAGLPLRGDVVQPGQRHECKGSELETDGGRPDLQCLETAGTIAVSVPFGSCLVLTERESGCGRSTIASLGRESLFEIDSTRHAETPPPEKITERSGEGLRNAHACTGNNLHSHVQCLFCASKLRLKSPWIQHNPTYVL